MEQRHESAEGKMHFAEQFPISEYSLLSERQLALVFFERVLCLGEFTVPILPLAFGVGMDQRRKAIRTPPHMESD